MSKQHKTTQQRLTAFVKEVNAMGIMPVIAAERLQCIADLTRKDMEKNPALYANGFVHPSVYLEFCNPVDKHFKS